MKIVLLKAVKPVCVALFAAGSGGNADAHLPLLQALADCGCDVVAPHFERMISPIPSAEDLMTRAEILRGSLKLVDDLSLRVVGIGHSIGAALLVALAGGQMWMKSGQALSIRPEERLQKLDLFTPPTGFFRAPGALDGVNSPLQIWAGSLDTIAPPSQVEFLKESLSHRLPVDFRLVEGAGHFTFMNTPPPTIVDQMSNREEFLKSLASDVCQFALN